MSFISPYEEQINYAYPNATSPFGLTNSAFNGFTISGPSFDGSVVAATVDPSSGVLGLTTSHLSFTSNSVTVNLAGDSFPVGAVGLIDVFFTTPVALPNILYGGSFGDGAATDDISNDLFQIYGPNNIASTHGGNETITGGTLSPYGYDNATSVYLGISAAFPLSNVEVNDVISLHGGNNQILLQTYGGAPLDSMTNSQLTITVSNVPGLVDVGGNNVDVLNVTSPVVGYPTPATSMVTLTGSSNGVTLSDEAFDTVTFDRGFNAVTTGAGGDGAIGFKTTVSLIGSGSIVTTGDSNDTITGGDSNNYAILGNGNNTVTFTGMSGGGNFVKVGDGNNTINTGIGGNAQVQIDQFGTTAAGSDNVTLGGGFNQVQQAAGGLSNVALSGGPGGGSPVNLANGNDTVQLGGGSNAVTFGNGADTIALLAATGFNSLLGDNGNDTVTVNGPGNGIQLGNGNDEVTTTGNSDSIALGNGNSIVNLNAGIGNSVQLGTGSNVVSGTAPGGNNVIVALDLKGSVDTLNLDSQSGNNIGLGNGNDVVFDNGHNVSIFAGNGNDMVIANGPADTIALLNGNNSVVANGNGDNIMFGQVGKGGSNTLTADGSNDTVTVCGTSVPSPSTDVLQVGSQSKITVTGGIDQVTAGNVAPVPPINGDNDTITFNSTMVGSTTMLFGNNDALFLNDDSSDTVTVGVANTGETITVNGDASKEYSGGLILNNFGTNTAILDLEQVKDAGGTVFNHVGAGPGGFDPQLNASNTAYVVNTDGGGTLTFTVPVLGGFNATDLHFS